MVYKTVEGRITRNKKEHKNLEFNESNKDNLENTELNDEKPKTGILKENKENFLTLLYEKDEKQKNTDDLDMKSTAIRTIPDLNDKKLNETIRKDEYKKLIKRNDKDMDDQKGRRLTKSSKTMIEKSPTKLKTDRNPPKHHNIYDVTISSSSSLSSPKNMETAFRSASNDTSKLFSSLNALIENDEGKLNKEMEMKSTAFRTKPNDLNERFGEIDKKDDNKKEILTNTKDVNDESDDTGDVHFQLQKQITSISPKDRATGQNFPKRDISDMYSSSSLSSSLQNLTGSSSSSSKVPYVMKELSLPINEKEKGRSSSLPVETFHNKNPLNKLKKTTEDKMKELYYDKKGYNKRPSIINFMNNVKAMQLEKTGSEIGYDTNPNTILTERGRSEKNNENIMNVRY